MFNCNIKLDRRPLLIFLPLNRYYHQHPSFTNRNLRETRNKQAIAQSHTADNWQSVDSDAGTLTPNFLFLLFSMKL